MNMAYFLMTSLMAVTMTGSTVSEKGALKSTACDFFTQENAMKIAGTRVKGVDGGMEEDTTTRSWKCTFSAAVEGENAPKIHFVMSKSISDEVARSTVESIRRSNSAKPGFEEWPGVGEEAILHSDGRNFQLVVVRKGVKSFRIKINPADGISFETVKAVAVSLAAKL